MLGRTLAAELWRTRYLITMREENLSVENRRRLETLCRSNEVACAIHRFMQGCYRILESRLQILSRGQTREDALNQRAALLAGLPEYIKALLSQAVRALRPGHFLRAITFLGYTNCPRTSNSVERANRYYRKRAKHHYRNRRRHTIWNMVKADLMVRRETYRG